MSGPKFDKGRLVEDDCTMEMDMDMNVDVDDALVQPIEDDMEMDVEVVPATMVEVDMELDGMDMMGDLDDANEMKLVEDLRVKENDLTAKRLNRGKITTYLYKPAITKVMEIDSMEKGIKERKGKKQKWRMNLDDKSKNGTMEPKLARKLKLNGKKGAKSSRRKRKFPGSGETVSSQRSISDFFGRVMDSGINWMKTRNSHGNSSLPLNTSLTETEIVCSMPKFKAACCDQDFIIINQN